MWIVTNIMIKNKLINVIVLLCTFICVSYTILSHPLIDEYQGTPEVEILNIGHTSNITMFTPCVYLYILPWLRSTIP